MKFRQRTLPVGDFAENEHQKRGIEAVLRVRELRRVSDDRFDVPVTALVQPAMTADLRDRLDVDRVQRPVRFERPGDRIRVVTGSGSDFQHAIARLRCERVANPVPGDEGSREPELSPLRVRTTRGIPPLIRRGGEGGERADREKVPNCPPGDNQPRRTSRRCVVLARSSASRAEV